MRRRRMVDGATKALFVAAAISTCIAACQQERRCRRGNEEMPGLVFALATDGSAVSPVFHATVPR